MAKFPHCTEIRRCLEMYDVGKEYNSINQYSPMLWHTPALELDRKEAIAAGIG